MPEVQVPELTVLGWREWAALPALGIARIKAKIDTGARSSALHAFAVEKQPDGLVRFGLRPRRGDPTEIWCVAPLLEERWVTDSSGNRELRPFIRTHVTLAAHTWSIDLSLTSRDSMLFRMLLGRTALAGRFVVDPAGSYRTGRPRRQGRKASP